VARTWVDCFDFQSNTVILVELDLRAPFREVGEVKRSRQSPKYQTFPSFLCYYKHESNLPIIGFNSHFYCISIL